MESNLTKAYDTLFENEWKNYRNYGPSARTRYRLLFKLLSSINSDTRSKSLLDCGCGTGQFLALLSSKGYQNLSGSDFSGESIKLTSATLERLGVETRGLFQADMTDLSSFKESPEPKFDIVTCSEVLEHIPDHEEAARTLHSLVHGGGYVLISVPYRMKYWSQHDELSLHIRRYEPGEMEKLLKRAGLKVEKRFVWGGFIYEIYSRLLTRIPPKSVMLASKPSRMKILICDILYHLFKLDDLLTFSERGRRIFVLARKP